MASAAAPRIRPAVVCALLLLLLLLLLLPASRAVAQCGAGGLGCPSGGNSTAPQMIMLVGHDGSGTPDPGGRFQVVLRDLANDPVPNATVRVQLAATDVGFCSSQQSGLSLVAPGALEGTTDATGTFTAAIRGFGVGPATHVWGGTAAAQIFANGVLLASVNVTALDLDGASGVGVNDMSVWLSDFGSHVGYTRDDYDGSGSTGVNDLSVWLTRFGSGLSAAGCSP